MGQFLLKRLLGALKSKSLKFIKKEVIKWIK
nr:MAG TPA: hypothetical protein [Caudoviricetes sp.]DAO30328.1 MAG TPA: hypothetical protein [Caudoviricetes sp.]DAW76212.1 MAG TPA: hypothetical protein [Caudoviricetes sp.]